MFIHIIFQLWGLLLLTAVIPISNAAADIVVTTVEELVSAVNNTGNGGDKTILVADGTYALNGSYLRIAVNGVILRSQSGKRENVILDGNYKTTEIIQIVSSDVTVADITIKRAQDHPFHVMGGDNGNVENTIIDNVHIIDPGEQAVKINPSGGYNVHHGIVRDSLIELTEAGRAFVEQDDSNGYPCYTGGVDAHGAQGWIIQDNEIRGFWCSTGLSEHGIHFWSSSMDTVVERNLIVNCDRGVGFGLGSSTHTGGIIRNNMIFHGEDTGFSDVGIGLESATGAWVYNNTIYHQHDYPNAIEYRFTASNNLVIVNNLTNRAITSRDGGTAVQLASNNTGAVADWFIDAVRGDLHLSGEISEVTEAGLAVSGLNDDFDKQSRPLGTGMDIGADEYSASTSGLPTLSWLILLLGKGK